MVVFLSKYWTHILLALVVGLGAWYVQSLRSTVDTQSIRIETIEADNKRLTSERDQLRVNYEGLTAGLLKQSEAIGLLSAESTKIQTSLSSLQRSIGNDLGKLGTNLGRIIGQNMTKMTCDQAMEYLLNRAIAETQK